MQPVPRWHDIAPAVALWSMPPPVPSKDSWHGNRLVHKIKLLTREYLGLLNVAAGIAKISQSKTSKKNPRSALLGHERTAGDITVQTSLFSMNSHLVSKSKHDKCKAGSPNLAVYPIHQRQTACFLTRLIQDRILEMEALQRWDPWRWVSTSHISYWIGKGPDSTCY